jgi:hypothetical protein
MTLRMIGDEIALADVLGLEAVRVLRPDMFDAMVDARDALGTTRTLGIGSSAGNPPLNESPVAGLAAVDHDLADASCKWLFPASGRYFGHSGYRSEWLGTWRKRRNVANPDVFRFYLERRLPEGVVPARVVDGLLNSLSDHALLSATLDELSGDELSNALERLAPSIDYLPYDANAPLADDPASVGLAVLLDQLPRMSARTTDSNPFGSGFTVGGIALRLVKRITDEDTRITVVRSALEKSTVISARIIMLRVLGHRPDVGMGIISEAAIDQLEGELRDLIEARPADDLAADPSPLNIARLLAETDEG